MIYSFCTRQGVVFTSRLTSKGTRDQTARLKAVLIIYAYCLETILRFQKCLSNKYRPRKCNHQKRLRHHPLQKEQIIITTCNSSWATFTFLSGVLKNWQNGMWILSGVFCFFLIPKRYTYMITASWQAEFHSFCHFLQPVLIYRKCCHQYAKLQCKRNCCLWPCTIDPVLHVWRLKMKPLEKLMPSITSGFWKLCITTRLWTPEAKSSSLGLIFPFGIP